MTTTSVKLANRLARPFDLDADGKLRLHRTMRNIVTRGIVPGTPDPDDARGTILLSDNEAATAVLLLPFADMAIDARALRDIANALLIPDPILGTDEPAIERALAAVRDEKEVRVIMELRWLDSAAQIRRSVRVEIEGEAQVDPDVDRLSEDWRKANPVRGHAEIPATLWLRAFLARDAA